MIKKRTVITLSFFSFLTLALLASGTIFAATYTVSKTADTNDGTCNADCSLREAITAANGATDNTIEFNIPGDTDGGCTGLNGVCTISPTSALPNINKATTTFNGYTQGGATANTTNFPNALDMAIKIVIDGTSAGSVAGLTINNVGSVVIKGLTIVNYDNQGINITGASATGNKIQGCYIGVLADGTTAARNSDVATVAGINVAATASGNIIGVDGDGVNEAAERNLISGNRVQGITFWGATNTAAGNFIGTDKNGTADLGNSHSGITIGGNSNVVGTDGDGTSDSIEGNLLSGNDQRGVEISGNTNSVAGNYIGTKASGTEALANSNQGILIYSTANGNIIGTNGDGTSDVQERNVIGFGINTGIDFNSAGSNSNTVAGNYIGVGADGTTDAGNATHGILIGAGSNNNTIGGDVAAEANTIAYNGTTATHYGISVNHADSDGNDILRNSFFNNQDIGIKLNIAGANNDQAAPAIDSDELSGSDFVISGTSTASATVQVFEADSDNEEGKTYVGQTTANGSGNWSFTITSPFNQAGKTFVAAATDATNGTSPFSALYTLSNNTPVASNQTVTVTEDTNKTITLGLTDADGDPITTTILTLPPSGTIYQTTDGTTLGAVITSVPTNVTDTSRRVIYVPVANVFGSGKGNFTFRGNDGLNNSNTATVTVNITAVADQPIANAQSLSLNEDSSLAIALTGNDPDGNAVTYVIVSNPRFGSLTGFNTLTGSVTYTPNINHNGTDNFSFWVYAHNTPSPVATVTLAIVPVNDAPLAKALLIAVNQASVGIALSATDTEKSPLTYAIVSNPSHGALSNLNTTAGTVTYTPTAGYKGSDSFTYKANDGSLDSNTATATLTVDIAAAENKPPKVFAGNDVTAVEGAPVVLTGVATDEDSDPLTYLWTQTAGTAASLTNTNKARTFFTAPAPDGSGDLEFTLSVSDGTDTVSDSVKVRLAKRNLSLDDAAKISGRVVAAAKGLAITAKEGITFGGRTCTEISLGNGSFFYSTNDSLPVRVITLGNSVVIGDPAYQNNAGVVVMADTAVLQKGSIIDVLNSAFAGIAGVQASFGDQEGDYFGYVIRPADIDGDGSEEIVSLSPGTSNGTLYVLSGGALETRNIILGSAAESLKSSVLLTTDLNGADGDDMLIGHPSTGNADLTTPPTLRHAETATPFSGSAATFSGIFGGSDLPTVIDLTTDSADFTVTASDDMDSAAGGDLDGNGSEDLVMSSASTFQVEVIFGSDGVGSDETALTADNQLTADDTGLGAPDSLAVDDVTGDGFADILLGFSTAEGGKGKIFVVTGRESWDADAFDLDNAISVSGQDGEGIGAWLILQDDDGDGAVDVYTNRGTDGSYLITLGNAIKEASTGDGDDDSGGAYQVGPGGFGGCALYDGGHPAGTGWMVLCAALWALFLFRCRFSSVRNMTQLLVLFLFILSLSACGGEGSVSSADTGSEEDETGEIEITASDEAFLTLTGRITSPTTTSPETSLSTELLSAGIRIPYVKAALSAGVRCRLYDLDGNFLGSVTTNESGDFATTVTVPDDDGDSKARVVVSCDNGIESYGEADLTADDPYTDLGIADVETTLAATALADHLVGDVNNWQGWGEDYSTEVNGRDMACLFAVDKALWESSSGAGEGLADENGVIKEVVEGFMAGQGKPQDVGSENWSALLFRVIDGEASDVWTSMVDRAADADANIAETEYAQKYDGAAQAFGTVAGTLAEQIAALHKNAAEGETLPTDVCSSIKDDTAAAKAFVNPLLASENINEFSMVYDSLDGMQLHFNLLKQCKEEGTCAEMRDKPAAFLGFMADYSGDYSSAFETDATPDPDVVKGMLRISENCAGSASADIRLCARGMRVTVFEGDGWVAFQDSGENFDPAKLAVWGNYWTNEAPAELDSNDLDQSMVDAFNRQRNEVEYAPSLILPPSVGLLSNRTGDVNAAAAHLAEFSYVILRDDQGAEWVPKIRAANPDAKILVYKNVAATRSTDCSGGVPLYTHTGTGMEHCWANANHPDWFALDTVGNRIEFDDFPNLWQMRVDLTGYQDTWYQNVLAVLERGDYDGVFMDDVNTHRGHWDNPPVTAAAWPTDANIESAFLSFITNVAPRFMSQGYLVIPNVSATWTTRFPDIYAAFAAKASGVMDEATSSWCGSGAKFGDTWWEWARQAHARVTSLGKIMISVDCTSSMNDVNQMRYSRASWLMEVARVNPGALMYNPLTTNTNAWHKEWGIDIGTPLGGRYNVNGGWRRDFTEGIAVVNPSETATITIVLGGTFYDTAGNPITSVTLSPVNGLILKR